jgi:hypothetical protein
MAHWDTSALLKLFLAEDDSTVFCALAAEGNTPVTAFIARHELQAAFTRREGEGSLQRGEADRLYAGFLALRYFRWVREIFLAMPGSVQSPSVE